MQRAIERLGQMQCDAVPWLSQKLALPVDMSTRWLGDRPTAAAAGAWTYVHRVISGLLHSSCISFCRKTAMKVVCVCSTGYACLDFEVPEARQLDNQQLHGVLTACLGKDG